MTVVVNGRQPVDSFPFGRRGTPDPVTHPAPSSPPPTVPPTLDDVFCVVREAEMRPD